MSMGGRPSARGLVQKKSFVKAKNNKSTLEGVRRARLFADRGNILRGFANNRLPEELRK